MRLRVWINGIRTFVKVKGRTVDVWGHWHTVTCRCRGGRITSLTFSISHERSVDGQLEWVIIGQLTGSIHLNSNPRMAGESGWWRN
jgi:hypothetical protein